MTMSRHNYLENFVKMCQLESTTRRAVDFFCIFKLLLEAWIFRLNHDGMPITIIRG